MNNNVTEDPIDIKAFYRKVFIFLLFNLLFEQNI